MLDFTDDDRASVRALLAGPLPKTERPVDALIEACSDEIRAALTRGWSASRVAAKLRDHLVQKGAAAPSIETIRARIRAKFSLRTSRRKTTAPKKISAAAAAAASPQKNKAPTPRPKLQSEGRNFGQNDPMDVEALSRV